MRVRALLRSVHTWGGLTMGLLVAVLALSGSALVFRGDFERWQVRDWLEVEATNAPLTLDQVVAIGAAQIPQKEVVRVVLPHTPRDSIEVILQKRQPRNLKDADLVGVFVDPYRGTVLGQRSRASGWLWSVQDFHYALFAGDAGLKVNGVGAAVLLGLALSGPLLWWPGWRRRAQAFRVRRQPSIAKWRDLHALAGAVASLALLLISVTALYFAYRTTAMAVVALASGSGGVQPPRASAPPTAVPASFDALLNNARNVVPEAIFDELRPSRAPGMAASASFRLSGDAVVGRHRVYLDPSTGVVLRVDRFGALPLGARVQGNIVPWHYGTFGGRVTQWLWFIAGLVPAGLFASGLWLWLKKR